MSEENKSSLLGQTLGDLKEGKRKAAKQALKVAVDDLDKALTVVDGIIEKIEKILIDNGESTDGIRSKLLERYVE